ncbi:hypothetical protein [Vibrio taketomensis]|uniref:hypothetical protein n=1 Tax=Vibrio taketomensis TaxID=2572923 RepID=UPI0038CD4752
MSSQNSNIGSGINCDPKAIDTPIDESDVIDARSTKPTTLVSQTTDNQISQSVELAQVQLKTETQPAVQTVGEVVVEQVELTESVGAKAIARAEKALDANNLDKAISGFDEALRYTLVTATHAKLLLLITVRGYSQGC